MNALPPQSRSLIGTFRTFGKSGPLYEVTGLAPPNRHGEPMLRIHVFDSGEDASYKLADVVEDPIAT